MDARVMTGWDIPVFDAWVDTLGGSDPRFQHAFHHPGNRANMLYLDGHAGAVPPMSQSGKSLAVLVYNGDPP